MCVRTKTTYGCGHVYKGTDDCCSSICRGVDRCHFEKSWDCRECESQGTSLSRGRDGKGRSAQKTPRSYLRDSDSSSSEETLTAKHDVSGGVGPWAPPTKEERTWESPHRKQADDAWLSEHDDRIMDLSERFERVKVAARRPRSKHTQDKMQPQPEYPDYDEYDHEEYTFVQDMPSTKQSHYIVSRHLDSKSTRSRSQNQHDRQHSFDSLPDSIPSHRSSPKPRQATTYNAVNAYPDTTFDYDYYNSPSNYKPSKQHHHHGYHQRTPTRQFPEIYYPRKSYSHPADYGTAPAPPPPLQISSPLSAVYDPYEYYSPGGSPPGISYPFPDYRHEVGHPPSLPRPHQYVGYKDYRGY